MNSENKLVIEQLNKYGRVPSIHELLQMIEQLQQENQQLEENYNRIYNENCKLIEDHNITDISLLDENEKLQQEVINLAKEVGRWNSYYDDEFNENLKLKKQLEEWGHHLKCSKEMLDIQGQKGNYDYDEYMLGLYNGMEYVIALFETREPNYISGKNIEFTNNRTQQKDRLSGTCDIICVSKFEEADDNLQE